MASQAELVERVAMLETKMARLEEQLDFAQAVEGIRRGLDEANRGEGMPLREFDAQFRAKHKIPPR